MIKLLEQTSKIVRIFNDKSLITAKSDKRLAALQEVLQYFQQFRAKPSKESFTRQCLEDLECCIIGTLEIIERILGRGDRVNLGYVNSDVIENHFCQVRTLYNGANNNPTYFAYNYIQNSIVLTQPKSLPGKRNAASYLKPPNR